MKGINLLKIVTLSAIGVFAIGNVYAQNPLKDNIAGNLGAVKFAVTAPTTVKGLKMINYPTWGPTITTPFVDVVVEKAYDTLGATTLLNGTGTYPSLSGKFALVFRGGGINFSDKVKVCIAAGAVGVIVVNNVPGDAAGMAATPATYVSTVPVFMVSDVDGMAMNNAIKASTGPGDEVKITLGKWGLGGAHDLGIVSRFLPLPSALNIPFNQISGASGTVYNKHYSGGAVANYGTSTETNVTVTDSVFWTPKGSSSRSFVTKNEFLIPSIAPLDSIKFGFGTSYNIPAPTTPGKYEHVYSISYANTDSYPEDNRYTLNQMITDSVYSKVPLDPTTGKITFQSGFGPLMAGETSTSLALVGSMMYVKNADLTNIKYMQYGVSLKDVTGLGGKGTIFTHILKWTDGVGGDADSFVQAGELKQIGISANVLSATDSSGDVFTVRMLSIVDPAKPELKVELEANSWYALVVEVPATFYLGYNERVSTFTRAYAQFVAGGSIPGSAIAERDEIARYQDDLNTVLLTPTNSFINYPFGAVAASTPPTSNFFVDSIFYDRYNKVPAIALVSTPNEAGSSIFESSKKAQGNLNVFPVPSSNKITVTLNLESVEKMVEIRLFDNIGRTVYADQRTNVTNDKFDIDISKLPSGNYHLVASTVKGLMSKPVVVIAK